MRLAKIYAESWKFLKYSKNYLYVIIGLFILFIVLGFLFPIFYADAIRKFIEQTLAQTEGLGYWQLFIFILKNNLTTSLLGLVLGLVLGVFPLILTISNGYVFGFVANKTAAVSPLALFRIIPHGIFELPAVVISLALGLRLGMFMFRKKASFMYEIENSSRVFLYIVIPLLIIAALIEACLIILVK